jgi:hypothetical protein
MNGNPLSQLLKPRRESCELRGAFKLFHRMLRGRSILRVHPANAKTLAWDVYARLG